MNVKLLLDFYHNREGITSKDILDELNVDVEFQEELNRVLDKNPIIKFSSVMDFQEGLDARVALLMQERECLSSASRLNMVNDIVKEISTDASILESVSEMMNINPFAQKGNKPSKTATDWVRDRYRSWAEIKVGIGYFLAHSKLIFQHLDKNDLSCLILDEISRNNSAFCGLCGEVENYIKDKIISAMPQINSISQGVRYVKIKLKEHFRCDNRMPKWEQCCEWPFDENGEPLVFQKRIGNNPYKYIFYDSTSKKEIIVEQFD